jgi:hypothetical protein
MEAMKLQQRERSAAARPCAGHAASLSPPPRPSPPAQVSCNDFDLVWELDSCYWMEKVASLYAVRAARTAQQHAVAPAWLATG